jgi:hypothetical protein
MKLFDISEEPAVNLYDLSIQSLFARFYTYDSGEFFLEIDQVLTPIFRHFEEYHRMLYDLSHRRVVLKALEITPQSIFELAWGLQKDPPTLLM